jgi:hypothetical protein
MSSTILVDVLKLKSGLVTTFPALSRFTCSFFEQWDAGLFLFFNDVISTFSVQSRALVFIRGERKDQG